MEHDDALMRLRALGFGAGEAETLWEHFDDAERRGKPSHGHARIEWLETPERLRPRGVADPQRADGGVLAL